MAHARTLDSRRAQTAAARAAAVAAWRNPDSYGVPLRLAKVAAKLTADAKRRHYAEMVRRRHPKRTPFTDGREILT